MITLDSIPISVKAIIGKTDLPLRSYLALQEGDILLLDKNANNRFEVKIGEKIKREAIFGLFETHKAVRIL